MIPGHSRGCDHTPVRCMWQPEFPDNPKTKPRAIEIASTYPEQFGKVIVETLIADVRNSPPYARAVFVSYR